MQSSSRTSATHDVTQDDYDVAIGRINALIKSWRPAANGFDFQVHLTELKRVLRYLFPSVDFSSTPTALLAPKTAQFSRIASNSLFTKVTHDYAAELDVNASIDGLYDFFKTCDRNRPYGHHMAKPFSADQRPEPRKPTEGLPAYIRRVEQHMRSHQTD